jgi:hypothetical protein
MCWQHQPAAAQTAGKGRAGQRHTSRGWGEGNSRSARSTWDHTLRHQTSSRRIHQRAQPSRAAASCVHFRHADAYTRLANAAL